MGETHSIPTLGNSYIFHYVQVLSIYPKESKSPIPHDNNSLSSFSI